MQTCLTRFKLSSTVESKLYTFLEYFCLQNKDNITNNGLFLGAPIPQSWYSSSSNDESSKKAQVSFSQMPDDGRTTWEASEDDSYPWIQVTFDTTITVMQIITQGSLTENSWVTSYMVNYTTVAEDGSEVWNFVAEEDSFLPKVNYF